MTGTARRFCVILLSIAVLAYGQAAAARGVEEPAVTGDTSTVALSPEVRFVMDRVGVSPEEAQKRLQRQDLIAVVEATAIQQLGSQFGGIWADIDRDRIVVATTGRKMNLALLDAHPLLSGHIEQRLVTNSLAELQREYRELVRRTADSRRFSADRIDLRVNRVILREKIGGIGSEDVATHVAARRGITGVEPSADLPQAEKRACRPRGDWGPIYCDAPLRGGVAIGGASKYCSGGFVAKSRTDYKLYLITAGHCLKVDAGPWSMRFHSEATLQTIGPVHGSPRNSPTQDFGAILIEHVYQLFPAPEVTVLASRDTTENEHYRVTSTGPNAVGIVVCTTLGRSGATTCGVVDALGVHAAKMTNLAMVVYNGPCNDGDSGSPVYKNGLARGIFIASADVGNCTRFYYQGIADALATLNLTLNVP